MEEKNYKQHPDATVKQSRIGEKSSIDKDSVILCSELGAFVDIEKRNLIRDSVIGDMSYTGADTSILWAEIGKYCCISRLVDIGGNEHAYKHVTMMPEYRMKNKLEGKLLKHPDENKIKIGNDVWIGAGAMILRKPGLSIGDGAVIGAGSVVTRSVPPYAIVAGTPARIISYRFLNEVINFMLKLKWWDWSFEKVKENMDLLMNEPDIEELKKLMLDKM
ncbi:MAG: CatB-related O-acetyltransferase [Lachnospiraceae bacterium]|nr:CatB-related O-acetyltransferase [Lachnospiraceae bacterium]MBQ9867614.1 CatB-related O-acetyltransferase [Lachnospiraceae bacterium]